MLSSLLLCLCTLFFLGCSGCVRSTFIGSCASVFVVSVGCVIWVFSRCIRVIGLLCVGV